jgi:intracellular multiplication protein IcmK
MKRIILTGLLCGFVAMSAGQSLAGTKSDRVTKKEVEAATAKKNEPEPTVKEPATKEPDKEVIDQFLGMTPEEIRYYKEGKDVRKEAAHEPRRPIKNVTRSIALDLSPGASPETIRVFDRSGAVVVFTDSTGAPWPVIGQNNFAKDLFEVTLSPEAESPVVMISTLTGVGQGTVAVFLKDLATPVLLTMIVGKLEADSRVDAIVPRKGPNAKAPSIDQQTPEFDPRLLDFLTKTPPSGARQLTIQVDGDASTATETIAWMWNDKLYVRSPLAIMSPAWRGVAKTNDGMRAYVFEPTPVLLVSDKGKVHTLRVGL